MIPHAKEPQQELATTLASVEEINRDLQRQIQKRKVIEKKLMKIQRLYDTMVRNFPDGVIGVLNKEMQYVLIDGKDLEQIELPVPGWGNQNTGQNINPFLTDDTLEKLKKAFDGEHVSCEVLTKDRIYHVTAVPLTDSKNNINEILCVMQNVTERKRMEEGLLKALEKEKELGELKSRFVTMASHEFRTPLTTILSSTFLLENYSGENYDKEKTLHTNRIKRSVNNLTMILNEFLSLEKLEEDKVKVVYTDINVPDYLQDLISEMEVVKKESQIVEYRHFGKQTIARLDHQLFWSIVTNLISNALKYSRAGVKIIITTELKGQCLILTVKDHGIGIPPHDQKYIFGRFYRASNAINFEGTGLGLHIVQKYVHLLNGNIRFESQLEVGTTFTVELACGEPSFAGKKQIY
jgi:signal transduction histidine kinase